MSHCNPRFPKMTDGKRLSTRQSPNIVAGPICLCPTPLPNNQIVQVAPDHSPVQSSHASKRLKTEAHHAPDKGKSTASPSSPSNGSDKSVSSQMHLRDDCSHVINEIRPKGSAQPKEIQENRRVTTTIKERLHRRVGNMVFEFFLFYLLLMTVDFRNFWTTCFILDI
jgi:hypothetical protein